MRLRYIGLGLFAAVAVGLCGGGCKKAAPGDAASAETGSNTPTPQPNAIARFHWLGMKRVSGQPNAAFFMSVWNLAESKALTAQTLDKLALALPGGRAADGTGSGMRDPSLGTNQPPSGQKSASSLRPILDDLMQAESYVEVRQETGQPGEFALAVRLDEPRSALWETNLADALESLAGQRPVPAAASAYGWQIDVGPQQSENNAQATNAARRLVRHVTLARSGGWTLLGVAQETNALVHELSARIQHHGIPFRAPATNFWLEADVDLRGVTEALALDWHIPAEFPRATVSVIGLEPAGPLSPDNGEHLITRAELTFPKPLSMHLAPWNLPTNLVSQPLLSFTAIRGMASWLSSFGAWNDLQIARTFLQPLGGPPNEAYFWGQQGMPYLSYCAMPMTNASEFVAQAATRLFASGNDWLRTHGGVGGFLRPTNSDGVVWKGHPFLTPYLKSTGTGEGSYVLCGLVPPMAAGKPIPAELVHAVLADANLVYYDWELTGPRLDEWTYMAQMFRRMLGKSHMAPDSAGTKWLQAIEPKLGNCGTAINQTGPDQLLFLRGSGVGFTGVELALLADWLESPQFPRGLHSIKAPEPVVPLSAEKPAGTVWRPR